MTICHEYYKEMIVCKQTVKSIQCEIKKTESEYTYIYMYMYAMDMMEVRGGVCGLLLCHVVWHH